MTPDMVRLVLDLDPQDSAGSVSIAGVLRDGAGLEYRFHGWLELCSLLEGARAPMSVSPLASAVDRDQV